MSSGPKSGVGNGEPDSLDVQKLATAKAVAEIAAADALVAPGTPSSGGPFVQTLLLKGLPGPAEESGGAALSGEDGVAAEKALEALGLDTTLIYRTLSRPGGTEFDADSRARLRALVAATDPAIVVALDSTASDDLANALETGQLKPGVTHLNKGIVVLAVDGLEASLSTDSAKRRIWSQLQSLAGATDIRV